MFKTGDRVNVCQYNEDCPPDKLCDRLNRRCINPCLVDSCGENADCVPRNHGIDCKCFPGFVGNAYVECLQIQGCRSDGECPSSEACINGKCSSPCRCGHYANCEVFNHRPTCKCPPGYVGNAETGCSPPTNACDPNPCGVGALCEIDKGNPICYCPKGMTGNPFKNCIPDGNECSPNPCGPNSGCRQNNGAPVCFCLTEYEGNPPHVPCTLPQKPCDPSPCGPNTQCTVLSNGFAKCTCLPNYIESPNTIRGCMEPKDQCDPNPCGLRAICDATRNPTCFCPEGTIGNPYRSCNEPVMAPELCNPGPCGINADCYVSNNREECFCKYGYIGDPYSGCQEPTRNVCQPNPCGPGAECSVSPDGRSVCTCPYGMRGDPTSPAGCQKTECDVDDDCSNSLACIGYRCKDPCPGSCGSGASCKVERHRPVCYCNEGLSGNPIIQCTVIIEMPKNPCMPSPCGVNTQCHVQRNRAVCSCVPDYFGDPVKGCRPECVLNTDCPMDKSCVNTKCVSPCAASICGVNAICRVEYHAATCECKRGYMGNPFYQCIQQPEYTNQTAQPPCHRNPCDPTNQCSNYGSEVIICDPCTGPNAYQSPQCRPECLTNSECSFDRACIGQKCLDPCPGSCGHNAHCQVVNHNPVCTCPRGLVGNPFEYCTTPAADDHPKTCDSVVCGSNARCVDRKGGLQCICVEGFFGNPAVGCRPECVINTDCPLNRACLNNKCTDPCVSACGRKANCEVVNHFPVCFCSQGYTGDALVACNPEQPTASYNPCDPSPCGSNSRCLSSPEGYAICSCLPGYRGNPPLCQPECVTSSDCPQNRACQQQKCRDPCPGTCGINALCEVINHNPICSCPLNHEGDPFISCGIRRDIEVIDQTTPCTPSPCGPNSICQIKQNRPVCSCVANFVGQPPYCRPECVTSNECPLDKACIKEKCVDPCKNACGSNANCKVIQHSAFCSCKRGFEGDAFVGCSEVVKNIEPLDPCQPSPCGQNAQCSVNNGVVRCSCIPPYLGDPYHAGCRPECVLNSECPASLACVKQHCRNPCEGVCGSRAECSVVNHIPVCTCVNGYEGDPFTGCRRKEIKPTESPDPCQPSPCGANSLCRVISGRPTCSCKTGYFGTPPSCRPECVVNSECTIQLACIQQKCVNPCVGVCGAGAKCEVVNHNPICSCPVNYIGDPFERCYPRPNDPEPAINPCLPSPCGANSKCQEVDGRAVCSCLQGMFGVPPNCRPECVINQDCPANRACLRQKCQDPCRGACGFNAQCHVQNHQAVCNCLNNFEGDPYAGCNQRIGK